MIGKWRGLTIECPDPKELSAFYREILGMTQMYEHGDWVVLGGASDLPAIGFHRAEDYKAPTWPDPEVHQQMHLDVQVDDLDQAEREVLELGAQRLASGDETFRVFADPAGHPFCLTTA